MKKLNNQKQPAIFLDRDGVLNKDIGYVYKIEDLTILPGVSSGLKALKESGYLLIVVTNQSGVARGYFNLEQVHQFHLEMQKFFNNIINIQIDDFMICPHHPNGSVKEYAIECSCRKPHPGLIDQALECWNIDLENSIVIGDKASDIELAKNKNLLGIQIINGQYKTHNHADFYTDSFEKAVDWILKK